MSQLSSWGKRPSTACSADSSGRKGPAYYTRPGSDHAVYVNFLIPSLDYWNEHQQDFIKLAADINAAI